MNLAIVGGSAWSTPALFLTPEFQLLGDTLHVTLIGRSESRLQAVRRAIDTISTFPNASIACATTLDALAGSDVVLLQARYGGYDARMRDETFPLAFGTCGDEGLGAGGFAAGWRSWPELARVLRAVTQSCPNALVLLMTSPLGLLVRCAREAFPALSIVGLCELPWSTLKSVCACADAHAESVTFDYAGINHLGWFDLIRDGDRDLVEWYAATRGNGAEFPSREIVAACNAVPLKYLDLHYNAQTVLARQRRGPPRAGALQMNRDQAFAAFESADEHAIRTSLTARATPWYDDAVAPCVAALAGYETKAVFFLTTANEGYIPALADDDVVERPFTIENGRCHARTRSKALSSILERTLDAFVRYERSAADAILHDRRAECTSVLASHPWCSGVDVERLSRAVIAAI